MQALVRLRAFSRLDLRLSTRLAAGFGLMLALVLLITGIALQRMQQMDSRTREIVEVSNQRIAVAQKMMNAANDAFVALYGFMLASDEVDIKSQTELFGAAMTRYDEARKRFEAELSAGDAQASLAQLKEVDAAAAPSRTMNGNIVRTAAMGGDLTSTFRSMDPRRAQDDWRKQIVTLVQLESEAGKRSYEAAQAAFVSARWVLLGATILAFGLGLFAALNVLRSVTRPLASAIGHAQRIAGGNLSEQIAETRKDETGDMLRALGAMQSRLREMVQMIRSTTENLGTACSEITQGNMDLSARTEHAASNLEQTASAMEQLTGQVIQTADAARSADQLATSATAVAARGGDVVRQVVETMGEIQGSSRKIVDIVGVIDGIAFQTNILALNAAVEAARAGASGRGFAVVAGEVRALAQRAASAAKEIKALIDESVSKVEAGTGLVDTAGASMSDIVAGVQRVSHVIAEISVAAGQQRDGIGQVNMAVNQLDQMTQQNAALVEQSAAATSSLQATTLQLSAAVAQFKL